MSGWIPPLVPQGKSAQDLVLETQEVQSGGDRRQFAGVARYAHRGDQRWVPPLPYARPDALKGDATRGFVVVARNLGLGDEAAGAIAARAETVEAGEGSVGWWGLLDAINVRAVSERLFFQAENWLFENTPGIAALRGPASMEPLTPAGLLVDGFDAWPAALLPYNPPYYPDFVEEEGYERERGWSAWTLDCPASAPAGFHPSAPTDWRALAEALDAGEYPDENAPRLRGWLTHLAGGGAFSAHPHLRWVLARGFGRAVWTTSDDGVCVGIPDFAPALRLIGGRLFPVGYALYVLALSRARRLRVFPALAREGGRAGELRDLYAQLAESAAAQGYSQLVIAPVFDEEEEESAEALADLGARITQRFAIYAKSF
ncbi:MAG: hypothetical protein MUC34_05915 [Anaerolineae bacterium]|jgi:hypothetical protein|nr:hypothetical protein [Anaerolineae bacterium]